MGERFSAEKSEQLKDHILYVGSHSNYIARKKRACILSVSLTLLLYKHSPPYHEHQVKPTLHVFT